MLVQILLMGKIKFGNSVSPHNDKVGTEVSSQAQRDPYWLSNQSNAPLVTDGDMGIQREFRHLTAVQTGFPTCCCLLLHLLLFLLLSNSSEVKELPLGFGWPLFQAPGHMNC